MHEYCQGKFHHPWKVANCLFGISRNLSQSQPGFFLIFFLLWLHILLSETVVFSLQDSVSLPQGTFPVYILLQPKGRLLFLVTSYHFNRESGINYCKGSLITTLEFPRSFQKLFPTQQKLLQFIKKVCLPGTELSFPCNLSVEFFRDFITSSNSLLDSEGHSLCLLSRLSDNT